MTTTVAQRLLAKIGKGAFFKADEFCTQLGTEIDTGGSDSIHLAGTLTVDGASTLTGAVHASNDMVIAGNSTITGNATITGTSLLTGNNTISGAVSLQGSVSLGTPDNKAVATCKIPLALASGATVASVNYTGAIPAGSTIIAVDVVTTTTFGAGTDSKFQLGSSVGGSDYVASTSVSLAGGHHMTINATNNTAGPLIASVPALDASGNNLYGAIVMTGTGSTVGGAQALVTYLTP